MIDFEKLGYKDITKDKPIHFRECLGEFFESTYPYSKRFYKQEGNISIELKVGNCHDICLISGTCYYSQGWRKFEVCAPEKYVNEFFIQTINAVKLKIRENIVNHYEDKYWDEFHCEEKEVADKWDGHTEKDVLNRLHNSNWTLGKEFLYNPGKEFFAPDLRKFLEDYPTVKADIEDYIRHCLKQLSIRLDDREMIQRYRKRVTELRQQLKEKENDTELH